MPAVQLALGLVQACRATCTVAASQCASGKPGSSASVRRASRSRSSPQLTEASRR